MKKIDPMLVIETYLEANVCAGCTSNNAEEGIIPKCEKCVLRQSLNEVKEIYIKERDKQ